MAQDREQHLATAFKAASEWLSSTPAAANLSNDVKLELYGLFKYIGSAAGPTGSRPSIFSPAPRAKHDAWVSQAGKYANREGVDGARSRYIQIANGVGWDGAIPEDEDDVDLERLDEDDDAEHQETGKAKPHGMGTNVSMMAQAGPHDEADDGHHPLHAAVSRNDLTTVQRILLQHTGTVDDKDDMGNTALHLAVDRGHIEIVKALIESGADKRVEDEDGQTPLMIAQTLDRADMLDILQ